MLYMFLQTKAVWLVPFAFVLRGKFDSLRNAQMLCAKCNFLRYLPICNVGALTSKNLIYVFSSMNSTMFKLINNKELTLRHMLQKTRIKTPLRIKFILLDALIR